MTTGRINQVDIFPKQKDRDAQRTTSEPPQHTRTAAFPFARNKSKQKQKQPTRARRYGHRLHRFTFSTLAEKDKNTIENRTRASTIKHHPSAAHTESRATTRTRVSPSATATLCNSISFYKTELVSPELQCHNFPHTHTTHHALAKPIADAHCTRTRRNKFTIETPRSVDVARRNTRPPDRFAQRESRTLTSHHNASNPRVPVTRRSAHSATRIVSIVTVSLCNAYQYNPNKQRACGKRIGLSDTHSATHDKQMPLAEL